MLKAAFTISSLGLAMFLSSAQVTEAATLVSFTGNSTGTQAQGTASITLSGNTLTGTLTNTSPFDARVMGFGFDLAAGNLNGFSGSATQGFTFYDGDFGNVPQFNGTVIDFGYCANTNPDGSCDLNGGGSPNNGLAPGATLSFTATGPFSGVTEAALANDLFVRFQRVGVNGQLSDVATTTSINTTPGGTPTPVPEPATMLLFGTGLLAAGRAARRRRTN